LSQEQVLAHIGVCSVNGYRVNHPYLVKDLSDMIYEMHTPKLPDDNTLPASINMDFNGEEDDDILATTVPHHYWWKYPQFEENVREVGLRRVTKEIISSHFQEFFEKVRYFLSPSSF